MFSLLQLSTEGESVEEMISDRGAIWDFRNSFFVDAHRRCVAVIWRDFIEVISGWRLHDEQQQSWT